MIAVCFFSTLWLGKTTGYILSNAVYWFVFCIPTAIYVTKGQRCEFAEMYTPRKSIGRSTSRMWNLLSFVPVVVICAVVFVPTVGIAPPQVFAIALAYALVNGSVEELFWRGLFVKSFDTLPFALVYPTVMFSCWHIALAVANGMVYNGGWTALVGGASFMGLLWGIAACKTGSVRYTTIAHIAANFLAFSGLVYENWFL